MKYILMDAGFLTHQSIFLWGSQKKKALENGIEEDPIPASYNYLNTVYGTLKKIGVTKEDRVLFCVDGFNSFRKAFYPIYKGQRKAGREAHTEIDWKKQYKMINRLEKKLNESTNWCFLQLNEVFNFSDLIHTKEGQEFNIEKNDFDYSKEFGIESDDIMAVLPKHYPNDEFIIVTIDQDVSQCCYYPNVKIFNPKLKGVKNKSKKGFYVYEENPLNILKKKVKSGDAGDNIIVDKKNDTEKEVEIRRFIIDLLNLPEWIEEPILTGFCKLDWNKPVIKEKLPFPNSLAKKFDTIYNSKDIRTYEESVDRAILKEEKRKEKSREAYRKKKEKAKV